LSLFGRFAVKSRIRKAAKALAQEPTSRGYVNLAREYVVAGSIEEVQRVCVEGLEFFPGSSDLMRLYERARLLQLDERIKSLTTEYRNAPRPAVYRELADALISAGRSGRAQEVITAWKEAEQDPEASYYQARVALDRFLAERKAADGMTAFIEAREAFIGMGTDPRPLQLQLEVASRVGAWQEARRILARLLEVAPGDQSLEARFRQVLPLTMGAKPLDQCLQDVEHTGLFVGDQVSTEKPDDAIAVRPLLRELDADADVCAAVYVRGGTALVQGLRGATADRTARAVRELVKHSRGAARRLGLGDAIEVRLEGDFGSLLLSPGELGTSAVWCRGAVKRQHEDLLRNLSGYAGGHHDSASYAA
jgi:tetratricopeptide (TPR) repeat protein